MLGRRQEMSLGEESFAAQGEKVGLGQYLVTQAQEAFRQTTTGVLIDQTKQRFPICSTLAAARKALRCRSASPSR